MAEHHWKIEHLCMKDAELTHLHEQAELAFPVHGDRPHNPDRKAEHRPTAMEGRGKAHRSAELRTSSVKLTSVPDATPAELRLGRSPLAMSSMEPSSGISEHRDDHPRYTSGPGYTIW
ncbi:hypothetical protein Dimus_032119, partial [Dionaea muscipula]